MNAPAKIRKLDEVVVNRIAAGEVIQRPANALKELIENSLDAKATNIQIVTKEGGLKLLQIQDNGTGIRKDDMEIVCERFTTSKLQKFEDLRSISTFGFRGEALASISHVALLTITTKTADEKCAYRASYVDSKLKAPPKSCAGNQGTTIMIENLFYNVATRRKALGNASEEFNKISDVVMKYAIHNPAVGFVLKKHGEITPQVRTPHSSTKMNNIRVLYGNPVSRELLEVEIDDQSYKFKMHALITNPNYTNKRMVFLLFINNRLIESTSIRKMLEDLYTIYLPKKAHPWCYISLEINPQNIDVNVHPTKHEVKFLHEDAIIERMKFALDEKLAGNSASRTFYLQARLPKVDITKDALKEVLPEYDKEDGDKSKKIHPREMIRTDSSDQKLDKFNFTVQAAMKQARIDSIESRQPVDDSECDVLDLNESEVAAEDVGNKSKDNHDLQRTEVSEILETSASELQEANKTPRMEETKAPECKTGWSNIIDETTTPTSECTAPDKPEDGDAVEDILRMIRDEFTENSMDENMENCIDEVADKARKRVYQYFGNKDTTVDDRKVDDKKSTSATETNVDNKDVPDKNKEKEEDEAHSSDRPDATDKTTKESTEEFKSYSVNNFRREVKLTSVLKLRKEVESNCHEGLRSILSDLSFVGCIDRNSAVVQSGVNLYLCDTRKLAEELFYEIMLYDFANYGVIKFSDPIPLYDLAMLGLETEEAGWTEEDGEKEELATSAKELLLEKADMMKEYFSIVIDKKGNLKSLPVLLDKYFPYEAGLPLYVLRLATEVEWSAEQPCFQSICRETAKFYSDMNPVHNTHDWKYITEHVLYPAIKESLLPPKEFTHDSTILQIASLPDLYKVFERC